MTKEISVWFPAVRTNTGTDVFTERLVRGLNEREIRASVTWLPLRAEYAPWTLRAPRPPKGTTIVHTNTWLHPRLIPDRLPLIATIHHAVHHSDTLNYKGFLRAAYHNYWIAPIERRVLKSAKIVVAVSEYVAKSTRNALIDVPINVIYNGVNTSIFTPDPDRRRPSRPFRLLYVGSWTARKGVELLGPIMAALGEEFELSYTGGPAAEKDRTKMPPNMVDIGRLYGEAAVISAMQSADALLFPSRSEGHPLVGIEAMACGLPMIAMEGSSVSELVTHGRNGYICKRDDVSEFVESARRLAASKLELSLFSRSARSDVKARFSETAMLDSYQQIYSQIVEARKNT